MVVGSEVDLSSLLPFPMLSTHQSFLADVPCELQQLHFISAGTSEVNVFRSFLRFFKNWLSSSPILFVYQMFLC